VLRKLLLVSFCVLGWVFFINFWIFSLTLFGDLIPPKTHFHSVFVQSSFNVADQLQRITIEVNIERCRSTVLSRWMVERMEKQKPREIRLAQTQMGRERGKEKII